jgi:hypothetical protein
MKTHANTDALLSLRSDANMHTGRDYPVALRFRAGRVERLINRAIRCGCGATGFSRLARAVKSLKNST